jgi:hypothetical protein
MLSPSPSGTINNGLDTTGVFGSANASLNGDQIRIVFTFDTSLGIFSSGTTFSQLSGGGSAVVTINGHSVTIVDVLSSAPHANPLPTQLLRNQDNGFPNRFTQANVANFFYDDSTFVSEAVNVQAFDPSNTIPISILQPYSLNVQPGQGTGNFHFEDHQPFQPPNNAPFDHQDLADVSSFSVDTLTVGVAAVPGPVVGAGLPGLLAGFGAMLAWYRKRRAVAV